MPQPFNAYLRGWLGLLEAKVQGQAPAQFDESVQPILDTFPFLFSQKRETVSDITGAIAGPTFYVGANGLLVPPADEIWLVDQFSVVGSVTLGAGMELVMCPAVRQISNSALTLAHPLGNNQGGMSWVNGDFASAGATRPFVLVPGMTPGVLVNRANLYVSTIVMFMSFMRARI